MGLLGTPVAYDPGTAVSFSVAALQAMTVVDATHVTTGNLTVPANGAILVKASGCVTGANPLTEMLVGVTNHTGGAVVARRVPMVSSTASSTSGHYGWSAVFPILGLTPGATVAYDLAIGVQTAVASAAVKYGGPNDTTTNNAWGPICLEAYSIPNLLAGVWYDPATQASQATTALLAQTALDTTHLRTPSFNGPASGNVGVWCSGGAITGGTAYPGVFFGAMEGAAILARPVPTAAKCQIATLAATDYIALDSSFVLSGVSTASHQYDLSLGVDLVQTTTALKWGGPNDAVGSDATGGIGILAYDLT